MGNKIDYSLTIKTLSDRGLIEPDDIPIMCLEGKDVGRKTALWFGVIAGAIANSAADRPTVALAIGNASIRGYYIDENGVYTERSFIVLRENVLSVEVHSVWTNELILHCKEGDLTFVAGPRLYKYKQKEQYKAASERLKTLYNKA